ncbi:hypothetical protein LSCM1_00027 [Leishmania martiniquensis]|uniref:Uncharacterized protein n=1 Tax=Leishmania martiniquensis TaxID=1580590 RepID=A0A836GSF0_9TRYP|nr:hypothetical protein LSCM1_00027 [Leishmania martiniquensis]
MTNIYAVTQRLIEELRANLGELRRSSDAQARLQRTADRKIGAAREGCHHHCPGRKGTAEKPRFRFSPLATAPLTGVEFSPDVAHSGDDVPNRHMSGSLANLPTAAGTQSCLHSKATNEKPSSGAIPLSTPIKRVVFTARTNILAPAAADTVKRETSSDEAPAKLVERGAPAGAPRARSETAAAAIVSSAAQTHSATAALHVGFSGASRAVVDLARLPPLARKLYADMERRAAGLLSTSASGEWRRRTAGPQDAELRRAVRDYLYRMNIISVMEVENASAMVPHAFSDAVLNGTALCQLVSTLREGGGLSISDPVPCRCPRTLNEVRVNYTVALAVLRSTPSAAQELVPPAAWMMTPEEVYLRLSPTALLSLFLHLIATYLPAPEELPRWKPHMCWQPPADRADYVSVPPAELAAAEAACGHFLHAWGVLPDRSVHHLPGDECLIPTATAAPYMAKWSELVSRPAAPPSLSVPSVWPYLCNGVLLVLLSRRSGAEAVAKEAATSSVGQLFFATPRTVACCASNIASALHSFQATLVNKLPLPLISEESVAAVIRGDRVHILHLLLHVRAAIEGTALPLDVCPALLNTAAVSPAGGTPAKVSSSALKTKAARASLSSSSSPAPLAQTSATIARDAFCPSALRSPPPRSLSPRPFPVSASCSPSVALSESVPPDKPQGRGGLCGWLRQQLGADYRYSAADESFVFDASTFMWQNPCLIFSDGVVLAYLIGRLERRRCSFLECVRPTSKKPAKIFNVRRCLEFLRFNAGIVFDVALLDEALTEGRVEGVVAVLQGMRRHYCLPHLRHAHHAV